MWMLRTETEAKEDVEYYYYNINPFGYAGEIVADMKFRIWF